MEDDFHAFFLLFGNKGMLFKDLQIIVVVNDTFRNLNLLDQIALKHKSTILGL